MTADVSCRRFLPFFFPILFFFLAVALRSLPTRRKAPRALCNKVSANSLARDTLPHASWRKRAPVRLRCQAGAMLPWSINCAGRRTELSASIRIAAILSAENKSRSGAAIDRSVHGPAGLRDWSVYAVSWAGAPRLRIFNEPTNVELCSAGTTSHKVSK